MHNDSDDDLTEPSDFAEQAIAEAKLFNKIGAEFASRLVSRCDTREAELASDVAAWLVDRATDGARFELVELCALAFREGTPLGDAARDWLNQQDMDAKFEKYEVNFSREPDEPCLKPLKKCDVRVTRPEIVLEDDE